MGFSIARTHLSPSPPVFLTKPTNFIHITPPQIHLNPQKPNSKKRPISRFASKNQSFSLSCITIERCAKVQQPSSSVSEKLQRLCLEFQSLPEPIERVKRLLQYAAILPPLEECWRIEENRVLGCTAQVWLEAVMDGNGAMRFRLDSDSEITKGFCSCLIWVLDGAAAEEVLSVNSRGNSRVNAWNIVLIRMQRRTKALLEERGRGRGKLEQVISVNGE